MPLVRVLATPAWTFAADLFRAPGRVLRAASFGSLAAFSLLGVAGDVGSAAAAVVAYTAFRAPIGALADGLLLAWAERTGGAFGRVRAWGSVGYLVAALGAGALLEGRGPGAAFELTLPLLAACSVSAWALPGAPARRGPPLWPAFRRLAREPRVARLLLAGVLHQAGLAPYDMLFPTWLARRAGGTWAGVAIAVGVACEVGVMVTSRRWIARLGVEGAMTLAFAAGVARCLVIAYATATAPLVLAQSLHALAFGLYYLAAAQALDRAAPPEVRASAQGIQYTVVFGAGSAAALGVAGALGGVEGVRDVFKLGAACSALAALLVVTAARGPARGG